MNLIKKQDDENFDHGHNANVDYNYDHDEYCDIKEK